MKTIKSTTAKVARQRVTKNYSLVLHLTKRSAIIRQAAICINTDSLNKSGGLITASSQAELADRKTITKLSRQFNLSYKPAKCQYHLRFDKHYRLISGCKNHPQRATRILTEIELDKLAKRLQCQRKKVST
jgi:hypothetical protein